MSVLSRERAGILARVGWYIEHGYTPSDFAASFGTLGPGENYVTINALWREGQKAYIAAQAINAAGLGGLPGVSGIPGSAPGRSQYRYTTYTHWTDPSTGETRTKTLQTVSPYQLGLADLQAQALDNPPDPMVTGRSAHYAARNVGNWELQTVEVITVERWG